MCNPIDLLREIPNAIIKGNPLVKYLYRTAPVPDNVASLITIGIEDELDSVTGLTAKDIDTIWDRVISLYRTGIHPGIVLCIRKRGKVILHRAIGHSHGNGPGDHPGSEVRLMTPDTPICQFSASKAVTAMLVHHCEERGLLHLNDPVSHYIPEFAANGKGNTTIYHLLTHQGGIPTPPRDGDPELIFDPKGFVDLLCRAQPESPGGRRMAYHAITGGAILGEIVERVTGMDIRDYLRKEIAKPLGFRYFNYGVDDEAIPLVARNYSTGWPLVYPFSSIARHALSASWDEVVRISNDPRFLKTVIPAGNLVATADEMCRFFQMLLNGGELDGVRIFDPLTIRRATIEADTLKFDGTMILPMRYSAGFMLGSSPVGVWGPYSAKAFGHLGFINIMCWADPERDLAVALENTGKCLLGSHLFQMASLISTIAGVCARDTSAAEHIDDVYASYDSPMKTILRETIMSG